MTDDVRGKVGPVLRDEAEAKAAAGSLEQYKADNMRVQSCMLAMLKGVNTVDQETLTNAALLLFCALLRVDAQPRTVAVDLVESAFDGRAAEYWTRLLGAAMTPVPKP